MSTLGNLTHLGLEHPSSKEFIYSPQNHVIAAFCLGCVFLLSLYYLLRSIGHSILGARLRRYVDVLPCSNSHVESQELPNDRVRDWLVNTLGGAAGVAVYNPNSDVKSVGALLSLSFTIASGMQFASLLTYSPTSGALACQFVVGSGTVAAGMARYKGLYKIATELVQLKVGKWESLVFRVLIIIALLEMLVFRYLSVGVLAAVQPAPDFYFPFALCYNRHFILPAAISVGLNLLLEIYALFRLHSLLVPSFLRTSHKFQAVWDIRLAWALSLLFLELATAAPTIYPFGLLADFVPFSFAAIVVLIVFNYRRAPIEVAPTATLETLSSFHPSRADKASIRTSIQLSNYGVDGYEEYRKRWGGRTPASHRASLETGDIAAGTPGEKSAKDF